MTYAASTTLSFGTSYPSLTLSAQIKDSSGTNVGAAITTGFVNLGNGDYYWRYGSFADGFDGLVVFTSTAGAAPAVTLPATVSPADALVPTAAAVDTAALTLALAPLLAAYLANAPITLTSPVAASGDVEIVRGADYLTADGLALSWSNAAGSWPDLTGATITFMVRRYQVGGLDKAGVVIVPTGPGQQITVELDSANTAALALGIWKYALWATLAGTGDRVPLAKGTLTVTNAPEVTP